MALLLLRRNPVLSRRQSASVLFKLQYWSKSQPPSNTKNNVQRSKDPCSSNHPSLWKSLLPPFPGQTTSEGLKIEIINEDQWGISSTLASVQDSIVQSSIYSEEPALGGEEESHEDTFVPEFDQIEDMRLQRKLFYKLERDSKEYEECSFHFYRRKSRFKEKGERKDVVLKKECPSKVDANQKLVRGNTGLNNMCGSFDQRDAFSGWKMERPKISASLNVRGCENVETYDARSRLLERKPKEILKSRMYRLKDRYENDYDNCNAQTQSAILLDNELPSRNSILGNPVVPEIQSDATSVDFLDCSEEELLAGGKKKRTPTYNQLTDSYHLPFCLDIYITKGSVRACIVHRVTSKVVAVAHSISKDLKFDLKSRKDASACAAIGGTLAQRALADDIHNVVYTPRKGDKIEGKLQIVLESIIKGGIDVKVKLKQKKPNKVSHNR